MNILYCSSEATPFIASGGLADVAGALPRALNDEGHDCCVILPLYANKIDKSNLTFICEFQTDVAWRKQYCGLFESQANGVTYYFIDNEYYFARDGIYGFYDDCERFVFFSRAILETVRQLKIHKEWSAQILHANDWQTALVPVYYQIFYKFQQGYENIKTVFTIHNIQYQGKYGREVITELMGIPTYHANILDYDSCVNMMKGALETADKITTVSPTYAKEILDPWYSHGLDRALYNKQYKLTGFLNGIDTEVYNPETDKTIAKNYSANKPSGKLVCKYELLKELNLPIGDNPKDKSSPVIGIVTRFVSHKGIDLIRYVFEDLIRGGFRFVILGSGEKIYNDFFKEMAWRYPQDVSVTIGFVPALSRKIYAGADMFLMPSQSEPCGLAQMIAIRYGTLPIVRETGGLKDSIRDCGDNGGNGFTFKSYNAHDMLSACHRAKGYYYSEHWDNLVKSVMKENFSWGTSAKLYIGLYKELTGE